MAALMSTGGKSSFLQRFQSKISVVGKDGSHAKVRSQRSALLPEAHHRVQLTELILGG
jgi:hypothetical protein